MRLAFDIAKRFLKASRGQTILILLGITIGVSVQIFIGSLIDGLQKSLIDTTIGSSSHVSIVPQGSNKFFQRQDNIVFDLRDDERIKNTVEVIEASAFILKTDETYPVLLRGFNMDDGNKIYKFDERLVEGRLPEEEMEVIMGLDLFEELNLEINEGIKILNSEGKIEEVKVVGLYDFKVASINKLWLVAGPTTVEGIFDRENQISKIENQIEDVFSADKIGEEYTILLEEYGLKAINWKDENQQLLAGLSGQSASSIMIQVFVLLAVLLGISSVLAISVVQKSRQLGILKAMGIKDKDASLVFLFQGLILGTMGAVLGALVGVTLSYVFSIAVTNPDNTPLVPFYLDLKFIIFSMLIAIVASMIAAFIPARKSSKLNPIEVIKNG